ncbi:MAG: C40 family peptidase [Lachnospiraceae bacterium]|nr:C40 family peptidase [Lachnospiraceae bacterium]
MRKGYAIKTAVCVGAISAAVLAANNVNAAGTICEENGLAGISLSLEQYSATADTQVIASAATAVQEKQDATEKEAEEEVSKYANMGISIADNYVNIRKKPNEESKVRGKLYRGAAATIVATKGDWVKIKSGNVKGYIKKEFLAIGFDAEELEDKFGKKWATVNTETLKVRAKKSTESEVLTLVPEEEKFEIVKETKNWVKIMIDEGEGEGSGEDGTGGVTEATKGYVSKDFVDISVSFDHAISLKEEKEEAKRKAQAQAAEQDRLEQLANEQHESSNNDSSSSNNNSSNDDSSSEKSSNSSNTPKKSNNDSDDTYNSASDKPLKSGSGSEIASYAQKFIGNPYRYGGTDLQNGTDCSGFTMKVYAHFGISIPRTSSSQASAGKKVSIDSLQPGDLVFYGSGGSISHVAMYIGGGQVVHASSESTGIKISGVRYRSPITARRIVG